MAYLRRILCIVVCCSCAVHSSYGWMGSPDPVTLSAAQKQDIRRFIGDVMECYGVPGLTLAVVGGDEQGWWEWTDSFGRASSDDDDAVTTQTLFNIGSTTKAFTATLLAMLLEESNGRYKWDTPVKEILDDSFLLEDTFRTKQLTLLDMLSHRVGIKRHDFLWVLGFVTERKEILDNLHLVGEEDAFRTSFNYNNLMYVLAGRVAEELAGDGRSWQQLIQEKIFDPLEMTSSNFLETMGPDYEGLARVQYLVNGSLLQTDMSLYETVKPVAAAGSIVSNAKDMAKWLTFQLSGGRSSKNRSLISQDALLYTHEPQTALPSSSLPSGVPHVPRYPVSEVYSSYALGWFQGHYRGYGIARHGGSLLGYESLITLHKQPGFGIYTSMNGPLTAVCTTVGNLIHMYIMDVVTQADPWLDKHSACSFPRKWQPNVDLHIHPGPAFFLDKSVAPSRDLQDFTGTYGSYLYGDLAVSANGDEGRLEVAATSQPLNFLLYPTGEEYTFQSEILGTKSFLERADVYSVVAPQPSQVEFWTRLSGGEVFQMELWPGSSQAVVFEKGLDSSRPPTLGLAREGCKTSGSACPSVFLVAFWCLLVVAPEASTP